MKFVHNLVTAWSRNMILVSNPTKIHISYSLKLCEHANWHNCVFVHKKEVF